MTHTILYTNRPSAASSSSKIVETTVLDASHTSISLAEGHTNIIHGKPGEGTTLNVMRSIVKLAMDIRERDENKIVALFYITATAEASKVMLSAEIEDMVYKLKKENQELGSQLMDVSYVQDDVNKPSIYSAALSAINGYCYSNPTAEVIVAVDKKINQYTTAHVMKKFIQNACDISGKSVTFVIGHLIQSHNLI